MSDEQIQALIDGLTARVQALETQLASLRLRDLHERQNDDARARHPAGR
jgi:hypothetical protein